MCSFQSVLEERLVKEATPIPVTVPLRPLVCPPAFQDNERESPLLSPIASRGSASRVSHWWLLNREPTGGETTFGNS